MILDYGVLVELMVGSINNFDYCPVHHFEQFQLEKLGYRGRGHGVDPREFSLGHKEPHNAPLVGLLLVEEHESVAEVVMVLQFTVDLPKGIGV